MQYVKRMRVFTQNNITDSFILIMSFCLSQVEEIGCRQSRHCMKTLSNL